MIIGKQEYGGGTLFLTNQRLMYEVGGSRGLLKASAPHTYLDQRLEGVSNITVGMPLINIPFFSKKVVIIEYIEGGGRGSVQLVVDDPIAWEVEVKRAVVNAKNVQRQSMSQRDVELHQRNVEVAKASAMNLNFAQVAPQQPQMASVPAPSNVAKFCSHCGKGLAVDAKFCSGCGDPQ